MQAAEDLGINFDDSSAEYDFALKETETTSEPKPVRSISPHFGMSLLSYFLDDVHLQDES